MNEIKKEEKERGGQEKKERGGKRRRQEKRGEGRREEERRKKKRWGVGPSQLAGVHSVEGNSTGYQYPQEMEEAEVH